MFGTQVWGKGVSMWVEKMRLTDTKHLNVICECCDTHTHTPHRKVGRF